MELAEEVEHLHRVLVRVGLPGERHRPGPTSRRSRRDAGGRVERGERVRERLVAARRRPPRPRRRRRCRSGPGTRGRRCRPGAASCSAASRCLVRFTLCCCAARRARPGSCSRPGRVVLGPMLCRNSVRPDCASMTWMQPSVHGQRLPAQARAAQRSGRATSWAWSPPVKVVVPVAGGTGCDDAGLGAAEDVGDGLVAGRWRRQAGASRRWPAGSAAASRRPGSAGRPWPRGP